MFSLATFRPVLQWPAHKSSVLRVAFWTDRKLVTQGRDNHLHLFELPADLTALGDSPASPEPAATVPVNALTYCKAAVLALPDDHAWLAVPSAVDDQLVRRQLLRSADGPGRHHLAAGGHPRVSIDRLWFVAQRRQDRCAAPVSAILMVQGRSWQFSSSALTQKST